jgi:hypothetical protein
VTSPPFFARQIFETLLRLSFAMENPGRRFSQPGVFAIAKRLACGSR